MLALALSLALVAPTSDGGQPSTQPESRVTYDGIVMPPQVLSEHGNEWRVAFSLLTYGYVGWLSAFGGGVNLMLGAGIPVLSPPGRRVEHAFGYALDLGGGDGAFIHRHRAAASGVLGRRWHLYYQASAGLTGYSMRGWADVGRTFDVGPSVGARIGLGYGYEGSYIMALGLDVDAFVLGSPLVSPMLSLSLIGGGRL